MPDETLPSTPSQQPNPGPTPTGYQRTQGGSFKWVPPSAEELSKLLPQYEIEALVGRGGMGAVYRGKQKRLDRSVAIKILPPEVDAEDDSYTTRFQNEAKIMAKLEHPAIVPVYDFGETSTGLLYFVMSFIDGTDVHQMIQSQGRLPPEHALAITAHVCDALHYAHKHGVIHRDIKPSNVLINMDGQVKVADFGLAKVDDPSQSSGLTKTGLAMGTPDYVAPETLTLGMTVDGRADLYAVGVMLYQMLTGRVPRGTYEAPSKLCGCDPRFDAIAFKAMKYDREDRYDTAAALRKDLDVILTTPLVQSGGKASAAIPQQSLPQKPVAKGPQKPISKSANVPVKKDAAPANPKSDIQPPKSKTPLLIGIGAVAAIAVGAFVMMGSGSRQTSDARSQTSAPVSANAGIPSAAAQLASSATSSATPIKVREEPKPAAAAPIANPKSTISNSTAQQFPPGKWVKVFTKAEDLPADAAAAGLKFMDGWITFTQGKQKLVLPPELHASYGVRAHFKRSAKDVGDYNRIVIRRSGTSPRYFQSGLSGTGKGLILQQAKWQSDKVAYDTLWDVPIPTVKMDDEFTIECSAVGKRLITRIGDQFVKTSDTGDIVDGSGAIYGSEPVRDIEVINLDGIPEAEALKILGVDEKGNDLRGALAASQSSAGLQPAPVPTTPSASKSTQPAMADASTKGSGDGLKPATTLFPPGQWVKVFTKFEDLPAELRKPDSGVKFENGWIVPENGKRFAIPNPGFPSGSNHAIRLNTRVIDADSNTGEIRLRNDSASYVMSLERGRYMIFQLNKGMKENFARVEIGRSGPCPEWERGKEALLEFATVGQRLMGRINNRLALISSHEQLKTGTLGLMNVPIPIRDIEVINLDGIPEAEALRILGVDEKGNDLRALAAKQEQQKAEQAKQADAMAAIPELKTLHEQFVKLQAERVTAPFEKDVAALNTSYLGGLDRKIAEQKKKGDLDGVLVLEAEKQLVASTGSRSSSDGGASEQRLRVPLEATAMPIPAEDADTTPATLKDLRKIYRDAFAKLEATRTTNLKALTDPLSVRLKQLESTLTQKNRVPDAKVVREYREGLGKESGPLSPLSGTNGPQAPETAQRTVRTTKKFPPGDDRKAAEWVIDLGGWVRILEGKTERRIDKKEDLPKRSFDLVALKLSSEAAAKRVIDYTDLTPIAGLRQLNSIDLAAMPVTDADCDVLASLPELARLTISKTPGFTGGQFGKLKHLDKLTYLYLGETGITAEGVAAIGELTNLEYLRLTPAKFGDADIAPLAKLKKLSTLLLGRGQLTLEGWKKLKGLFIKDYLGFTPQAGQMQQWCEELARLFPAAHRLEVSCDDALSADDIAELEKLAPTRVTLSNATTSDEVVAAIAAFPKLDQVILSSGPKSSGLPDVTDASMAALAAHKDITLISFNDVRAITADGLMKLAALKTLKALELIRCRQLDAAATDAFKKARPDVKVSVE